MRTMTLTIYLCSVPVIPAEYLLIGTVISALAIIIRLRNYETTDNSNP